MSENKHSVLGDLTGSLNETSLLGDVAGCDSSAESVDRKRVTELGQYRRFLRQQAMGISPHLQSKLEPSDIVQQTMLDAHRKLNQFRGHSQAEMARWLSQMLANNVADAVRAWHRQKRNVRREQSLTNDAPGYSNGTADWLASDHSSPSLCLRKAEQWMKVADAIKELPEDQQQVIVFHHLHGFSLNEVAERMNRSSSAVAGLLYRGLKSLRTVLAS